MHRLVRSVLLPGEEVLGDRVQDVRAENLEQRSESTRLWKESLNTLSWKTSFVTGLVHFTIGMFMLMILNLFGLKRNDESGKYPLFTFSLVEGGPKYPGTRTSSDSPCIESHEGQTPAILHRRGHSPRQ